MAKAKIVKRKSRVWIQKEIVEHRSAKAEKSYEKYRIHEQERQLVLERLRSPLFRKGRDGSRSGAQHLGAGGSDIECEDFIGTSQPDSVKRKVLRRLYWLESAGQVRYDPATGVISRCLRIIPPLSLLPWVSSPERRSARPRRRGPSFPFSADAFMITTAYCACVAATDGTPFFPECRPPGRFRTHHNSHQCG